MAGQHLRSLCLILRIVGGGTDGSIGHHGNGGTVQIISIHIVAGLQTANLASGHSAGQVKGGHRLLRVRRHRKVVGKHLIFFFGRIGHCIAFFGFVPGSRRGGDDRCRHTVNVVGGTGKASRAGALAANAYRSCAAEFRHIRIIGSTHGYITAGCVRIQLGIQHFRGRFAAYIVQVDHAGQGSPYPVVAQSHSHAAVGHDRGNGMGRRSIHDHAGFLFFPTAFLQPADAVFFGIPFPFFKGPAGPGIPAYRAVDHVFFIVCVICQRARRLDRMTAAACGHDVAVFNPGTCLPGKFVIRSRHAKSSRDPLPAGRNVQYAGIVGDGFIALRYDAHIPCAVDIRLFYGSCNIVFNIVMTAGTAYGCYSLDSCRSAHANAEDFPLADGADIQISHVHGSLRQLVRIGHSACGAVLNPVYAYRYHTGQERIRPGKLHGSRTGF